MRTYLKVTDQYVTGSNWSFFFLYLIAEMFSSSPFCVGPQESHHCQRYFFCVSGWVICVSRVLSHYFLCCPLVGNFTWNMVSCCSMRTWCKIQQGPKCWCWVRNLSGTWCGQKLGKGYVSKWHVTWNLHGYVEELDVSEGAEDFAEVHLDSLEFCLFFRYL